jgi:hypothetical protein
VPSRRSDALGRRTVLVAIAAPIAAAGVIGAVALAAPALAAGPTTPLPFPTVCGSTTAARTSASASPTPSTTGSSAKAVTKKTAGSTPSPGASSPSASASPSASGGTGAANAPNGGGPATPTPSPSASSPSSSGGFWGWLNGVWTWIFGAAQLPHAPAAAVLGAANAHSGSNVGAASVQTTGSKPVVLPKITTGGKAPALAVPSPTTQTSTGSPSCVPSSAVKRDAATSGGNVAAQVPWHLSTPSMTQYNLTYNGTTTINTVGGGSLQVLDFTASKVTLVSMITFSQQGGGKLQYVDGGQNQTVTLENVHLWTTELKANLLGLIPVDYTPSSPPPLPVGLTIPIPLLFTSVEADNAFLSTQSIVIPGFNGHGN